jgi:hypothetical protein
LHRQDAEQEVTIFQLTGDAVVTRGGGAKKIPVEALAAGMSHFLETIAAVIKRAPEAVGRFPAFLTIVERADRDQPCASIPRSTLPISCVLA